MIYAVAPRECEELYGMLVEHYRDEPNVTVIFDRRQRDRRARGARAAGRSPQGASGDAAQRRRVRDRRRARVAGELSSVVTVHG